MSIRIVRLGSAREPDEGLRIGAVRRPPRGVPKDRFATDDWYDVWLPQLAPSADLVKQGQSATTPAEWQSFERRYQKELNASDNTRLLVLMAALSQQTSFSLGCYCEDESRCHRSVLRRVLSEQGAEVR